MRAIWGLVLLCLVGCNATPTSVGEACDEYASEVADVAGGCNISGFNRADVVVAFDASCCAKSGTCQRAIVHVDGFFQCKAAIPKMSCLEVTGGDIPSVCIGVLGD